MNRPYVIVHPGRNEYVSGVAASGCSGEDGRKALLTFTENIGEAIRFPDPETARTLLQVVFDRFPNSYVAHGFACVKVGPPPEPGLVEVSPRSTL